MTLKFKVLLIWNQWYNFCLRIFTSLRWANHRNKLPIKQQYYRWTLLTQYNRMNLRYVHQNTLRNSNRKSQPFTNHQQVESTHSDHESESSDDPEKEIYRNLTAEQLHRARTFNECFICQKRCANFSNFRSHVVRHTSVKKYRCDKCLKEFAKLSYLKAHLTTHNENRIFTCEICSQNFATKPSIRGHMRIHTGMWKFYPYPYTIINSTYLSIPRWKALQMSGVW